MDFEQRFEKKMELIQDTLALGFAKNAETDRVLDKMGKRLDDVVKRLDVVTERLDDLAKRQDKTDRQINGIKNLIKGGMAMIVKIDRSQKRTEATLKQWMAGMEGSNGHKSRNGHKKGPNGRKKGNGLN